MALSVGRGHYALYKTVVSVSRSAGSIHLIRLGINVGRTTISGSPRPVQVFPVHPGTPQGRRDLRTMGFETGDGFNQCSRILVSPRGRGYTGPRTHGLRRLMDGVIRGRNGLGETGAAAERRPSERLLRLGQVGLDQVPGVPVVLMVANGPDEEFSQLFLSRSVLDYGCRKNIELRLSDAGVFG